MENKEETTKEVKSEEVDNKVLLEKIEALEQSEVKNQETIKMLTEISDKGRMLNYQSKKDPTKKPMKVSLSIYEDKIVTGWRTIKDMPIFNPTTGLQTGEVQEYEILLLDKEGKITKGTINGYKRFSDMQYNERIEVEVAGKKEDYDGKITYTVLLPDGREIDVDSRFIN